MNYLSTLKSLLTVDTEGNMAGLVNMLTEQLIKDQGHEKTMQYRHFMLSNQAEVNVSLQGIVDHLARDKPKPENIPNEAGVLAAFRYIDTSTKSVDYMILAIPGFYAVYIITLIDKILNKQLIQGVYGCVINPQWLPENDKDGPQVRVTRASTMLAIKQILGWLDIIGKGESFNTLITKPTPAKPLPHVSRTKNEERQAKEQQQRNRENQQLNRRVEKLVTELAELKKAHALQIKHNEDLRAVNTELLKRNDTQTEANSELLARLDALLEIITKPNTPEEPTPPVDPYTPPEGHEPVEISQ